MTINTFLKSTAACLMIAVTVSACTPKTALRGNAPRETQIERLEIGVTTKQDVASVLGTPSVVSTFDSNTWYYISRQVENWAFLDKKLIEQQVVAIHFDENSKIHQIEHYTKDDAREIAKTTRTTPTAGKELGFFEQIFGNFGRGLGPLGGVGKE